MHALYQRLRELDPKIFEDLCFQIIAERHPGADIKHVSGSGGDKGIDIFQGDLAGRPTIWQCKFFANGVRSAQKTQIKKSLKVALRHFHPARWILCLPVDLDTNGHAWFQQLRQEHVSRVEIGIFQASDIVRELVHRRVIRNSFFPGAILDPLELRSLLARTGEYSDRELEKLTLENVHQYLQRLRDRDARFNYQLTFLPQDIGFKRNFPPGLVASITDSDKTIDIFARDVEALQLDPPTVRFGVKGDDIRKLQQAIETGTSAELQVSDFRSSFDFVAPVLPDPHSRRVVIQPLPPVHLPFNFRVVFGTGDSAVRYECLTFRRSRVGTKEVELSTADEGLPFALSIVLRLSEGKPSPGATFSFETHFRGREVRLVRKFMSAMAALKESGAIEVWDLQREVQFFSAKADFDRQPELNRRLKVMLDEICEIADRFQVSIPFPEVVSDEGVQFVPFFLELARKGEAQMDLSDISVTLTKSTQHQDKFLAALKSEKTFKFDLVQLTPPIRIFDTEISIGPCSIISERTLIEDPDKVLQKYLSAEEGEGVVVQFRPLSPARIILRGPTPPSG